MGLLGKAMRGFTEPGGGGLSLADRLAIFASAAAGDPQTALALRDAPRKRQQEELLRQAAMQAAGLLGPAPGAMRQVPIANDEGQDITSAFGPVMEQGPGRRRSAAEAIQELAGITGRTPGFNPTPWREMISAAKPDLQSFNNVLLDKGNPGNEGLEIPEVEKGQLHVFDSRGNAIGVMDANGYVQSLQARKEAEARGTTLGSLRDVGTGDGGTLTMTGREFLGGEGGARGPGALGYTPPAAQLAADRTRAEAGATADVDLPRATQTADDTLALINALRNHPGRKLGTGFTGLLPGIPGTQQKDFVNLLDQAKGKAFLEAFATLKGGGQITEVEGKKATEAIARLDRTQSEDGFLKALSDLESVVRSSQRRALAQPGRLAPPGAARQPAAPRTSGKGWTIRQVQ